jgi:hypothetical protein
MSIAASNFTNTKKFGHSTSYAEVRGKFTGPASYTSGGEQITTALAKAAFRGLTAVDSVTFGTGFKSGDSTGLLATWDFNPTAGTDFGKIRFFYTGQSAHTHDFVVSGNVTTSGTIVLATGLGGSAPALGRTNGTNQTLVGGGAANIQNSTATLAGTEVAAGVDLSGYVFTFVVRGR